MFVTMNKTVMFTSVAIFCHKTADFPDEKLLSLIIELPFPSKKALKDLNTPFLVMLWVTFE